MKKLSLIFCLLITQLAFSFDYTTPADRFSFEERYIDNMKFNTTFNITVKLLNHGPEQYNFLDKLAQMNDQYKAQKKSANAKITIHQNKYGLNAIERSSELAKEQVQTIKSARKDYKEMVESIEKIQLEHIYIERMNCKTTMLDCYELSYTDAWRENRLSFFPIFNYLNNNFEDYQADAEAFREQIIDELDIEAKLRDSIKSHYNCWKNDCSSSMRVALDNMLESLSEFVRDQKSYIQYLADYKITTAESLGIDISKLKALDKFSETAIGYPNGKFELAYAEVEFILENYDLNLAPIKSHLDSLQLNQLISITK